MNYVRNFDAWLYSHLWHWLYTQLNTKRCYWYWLYPTRLENMMMIFILGKGRGYYDDTLILVKARGHYNDTSIPNIKWHYNNTLIPSNVGVYYDDIVTWWSRRILWWYWYLARPEIIMMKHLYPKILEKLWWYWYLEMSKDGY